MQIELEDLYTEPEDLDDGSVLGYLKDTEAGSWGINLYILHRAEGDSITEAFRKTLTVLAGRSVLYSE